MRKISLSRCSYCMTPGQTSNCFSLKAARKAARTMAPGISVSVMADQ